MNRLKTYLFLLVASLLQFSCGEKSPATEAAGPEHLTSYVNPFIGTGGHGHTYPGATLPYGMVQLSPDTRLEGWDGCSGYHFSDSIVYGFSHTHLSGTGVSDYGDILLMPMTGPPHFNNGASAGPDSGYASRFRKADEQARPGYYRTVLSDYNIEVELTATERCGLHRYTAKAEDTLHLILDLEHRDPVLQSQLIVLDKQHLEGYRFSNAWARDQRVYFAIEFSRPYLNYEVQGERARIAKGFEGKSVKGRFTFPPAKDGRLEVRVGISGASLEGARANLLAEAQNLDFETAVSQADSIWNEALNKIVVKGGTEPQMRIFYTALYHTMIVPNLFSDVNGEYRGMDGENHKSDSYRNVLSPQYTVFSFWDTFRATHPLYTLIEQERTNQFIRSLLRKYQEGGILPIWELGGNYTGCMIGYHAIPVIADAYLKGIRNYDADLALEAMVHSARQNHLGLEFYKNQGFIGAGQEAESVSKTLEYAYDDWCIAMMARAMGRSDIYTEFIQRAQFYKNLFDPATGFFRAKQNGGWMPSFDPREVNFNFTEANAWQYSLFVPQDIAGLMTLLEGSGGLESRLDSLFVTESATTGREQADITGLIGQYAHGNEPSHHMAYLYSYTGASPKTQQRVRQIMDELYHDQPDGLSGNEDCGQMSAWYVLSAMGFYPVTPGSDQYVIGTPLFPEATLNLENGLQFRIFAEGVSEQNIYLQSAELNGKPYQKLYLIQETLMAGGELRFVMGPQPNPEWAGLNPEAPKSSIDDDKIASVPFFDAESETFTDSIVVGIHSVDAAAEIRFTLDGSDPLVSSPVYVNPIPLKETATIRARAFREDGSSSFPTRATYHKVDGRRQITLSSSYANQYSAGGDRALIDYLRGGLNFRTGRWQGYQEDLKAVVDLGEEMELRAVGAGFLQDIGSWIWFPKEVEFALSKDGRSFQSMGTVKPGASDAEYGAMVEQLGLEFSQAKQARYVRIRAMNYGKCPPWHLGAGGQAWIFVDEVWVE